MNWPDIAQDHIETLCSRAEAPERMEHLVERLGACVEQGALSLADAGRVLARLQAASDPADTLLDLLKLCESDDAGRLAEASALDVFLTLAMQGEHPSRALLHHPEDLSYLAEVHADPVARGLDALVDEVESRIEAAIADGAEREQAAFAELRRLKRRESLRIYLREVDNTSSVRQTTAEIAQLAEACLDVACRQGARVLGLCGARRAFLRVGDGQIGRPGAQLQLRCRPHLRQLRRGGGRR